MKNYYEILGIQSTASSEEIKQAYRKLSLKFHPDKNGGDNYFEEWAKKINEAYETLGNTEKRRVYDKAYKGDAEPVKQQGSTTAHRDYLAQIRQLMPQYMVAKEDYTIASDNYNLFANLPKPNKLGAKQYLVSIVLILVGLLFLKSAIGNAESNDVAISQRQQSSDTVAATTNTARKKKHTQRQVANNPSIDTQAIVDAVIPRLGEELHQSLVLTVTYLKYTSEWAFVLGKPSRDNGEPIDYEGSRYETIAKAGKLEETVMVLLRFRNGYWQVMEFAYGNPAFEEYKWLDKYEIDRLKDSLGM